MPGICFNISPYNPAALPLLPVLNEFDGRPQSLGQDISQLPSSTDMINAHATIVNTLADEMKTGVHVLTPVINREFTISAEIRGKPFLAGACASSLGRIAYMGRQGVASVQQSFVACRRMANAWHRASGRPSDVDFSLCLSFWRRHLPTPGAQVVGPFAGDKQPPGMPTIPSLSFLLCETEHPVTQTLMSVFGSEYTCIMPTSFVI